MIAIDGLGGVSIITMRSHQLHASLVYDCSFNSEPQYARRHGANYHRSDLKDTTVNNCMFLLTEII
jgi:hypothetical protein